MKPGRLYVISGPSGVGKGTIVRKLLKDVPNIELSVSATTRDPREGEKNGEDYYFYDEVRFKKEILEGNFLEYAKVHGNYYGTLKSEVQKKLDNQKSLILEIDVQGGMQVKKNFQKAILIFIKPPSLKELKKRLILRGTDEKEVIEKRLKNSLAEMEYEEKYDYSIVNDKLSSAVKKLKKIILGGNSEKRNTI
ncbi:MAG: guanylate kinase [Fusobacteriota bacterium]